MSRAFSVLLVASLSLVFVAPVLAVDPPTPEELEQVDAPPAAPAAPVAPPAAPVAPAALTPSEALARAKSLNAEGLRLRDKGRDDDALLAYEEAVELAPDYVWGRFNLACELARRGRVDDALPHLAALEELDTADARLALARAQQDYDFDPVRHHRAFDRLAARWRPRAERPILSQLCGDPWLAIAMMERRAGVIELVSETERGQLRGRRLRGELGERFLRERFTSHGGICGAVRRERTSVDRPLVSDDGHQRACIQRFHPGGVSVACFVQQDAARWTVAVVGDWPGVAQDAADATAEREYHDALDRALRWYYELTDRAWADGPEVRPRDTVRWLGEEETTVVADRTLRLGAGRYEVVPFPLNRVRSVHVRGTVRTATPVDFFVMDPDDVAAAWAVDGVLTDGVVPYLPELYREQARDLDETAVVGPGHYGLVVLNRGAETADVRVEIQVGPPPAGRAPIAYPPAYGGPRGAAASGPGRYELVVTGWRVTAKRADGEPWDVDGSRPDVKFALDQGEGTGVRDRETVQAPTRSDRAVGAGGEEAVWRLTWDGRGPVRLRVLDDDTGGEDVIAAGTLSTETAPARPVVLLRGEHGAAVLKLAWRRLDASARP